MDRGAWRAMGHGVAKRQTRLKQLSMHAWGHHWETLERALWPQSSYLPAPRSSVYCYYQLHQAFVREELGCQSVCKEACR